MTTQFITCDFLLQSAAARTLYHEYAEKMPIYDYHCHLPAQMIADDHGFENLTQAWLTGDHYKWRAMRTNGVAEDYITGHKSDFEKFEKWAETVPFTLRNPLYHWTHLELMRYFGITEPLNHNTAKQIYEQCTAMLRTPQFSVRNLLRRMNVKLVCTTEGPLSSLPYHKKVGDDRFEIRMCAAFRPDKALAAHDTNSLNAFIDKLEEICTMDIEGFEDYVESLNRRHEYFHSHGCRISDFAMETICCEPYTDQEAKDIFDRIKTGQEIQPQQQLKFKSAVLFELACMDASRGWVMQLHLGALRNTNSRMFKAVGPDAGCDSIGDFEIARPLAKFLDRLHNVGKLPKTVIYNLNPRDSELIATMIGNFQDGSSPGKLQYGPGWWFLDQKDGMEKQIETLSNMGLLSRFVGMTTDSRSFLSFPRHEYFRRILCNIIGRDVEQGLLPNDMLLLGQMVQDICFNNAKNYFAMMLE